MWIGTKHGIYRFNGIQVKAYHTAKNQTIPLKDIFHIQEDRYRRLWTIASGTILRYNLLKDSFETVAIVSDHSVYNMFHIDRQQRFWCHWSDTLRTYTITPEGELRPLRKYAIPINDIRGYDEDARGRIWCISESQGIFRINPKPGIIKIGYLPYRAQHNPWHFVVLKFFPTKWSVPAAISGAW
ncbi:MAG: hypothetical protein HWD58_12500 [Bacteroidota bacterium]|nr:MAG: hypothetical protein HWD58_12500 [Bacteroidota bacterium]